MEVYRSHLASPGEEGKKPKYDGRRKEEGQMRSQREGAGTMGVKYVFAWVVLDRGDRRMIKKRERWAG